MGYSLNDFKNDVKNTVSGPLALVNPFVALSESILEYIGEKIVDYLAPDPDYSNRKIPSRGPTNPRRVIYGQARVSGQVAYMESSGSNNEFLNIIYVVASHSCESISEYWIGDTLSTDAKYSGLLVLESNLTGDGNLLPIISTNTSLTAARHKFRGLSYVYAQYKYDNEVFQGQPLLSVTIQGKNNIFDPRNSLTGYSDNSALCLRDWIQNYLGATNFDNTWVEAANDCDVVVPAAGGTTEKRFRLAGTISLSGSRLESLSKMTVNSGVIPRYEQGVWGAVIQKYEAPVASYDENDLIADLQMISGANKQDKINTVKGSFISATNNYEQIEYPALESENYITEDLEVLDKTIDYQMVGSGTQCRRLSKIILEKSRFGLTVSSRFRFDIWQHPVGSRINFSYSRFGWVNRVFRIVSRDIDGINGIEVVLREDSPEIYDWNEGDAIDVIVPPSVNLPNPDFVATPSNLTGVETLYIANTTKSVKARLTLDWDTDDITTNHYEVEGSLSGAPFRIFNDYVAATEYAIDDLELGSWIFRVRAVNGLNAKSGYINLEKEIIGKNAPPSDVTGFDAIIRTFSIIMEWAESPDLDIASYEVRLGSTWETATVLQSIDAITWEWETRPTGNEILLIKAIDTSGNYSLNAAEATITIQDPAPVSPITKEVINNNVLLRWADATTSFAIDNYEVRKGVIFDTAEIVGTVKGTFNNLFELTGGDFTYWVYGVDVKGNTGSPVSISVSLSAPPDFVLLEDKDLDLSDPSATVVNLGLGINPSTGLDVLIGPTDLALTWDGHFQDIIDNHSPAGLSIQEMQGDLGYPYYLQPTVSSGSFEITTDLGTIIPLAQITLTPDVTILDGSPVASYTVSYSDDDVTYTDEIGTTASGINFRYVKVLVSVSAPSFSDLLRINNLNLRVDVKRITDDGKDVSLAVGAKTVLFNASFIDVNSIQVTPNSSAQLTATVDFNDVPNPTSFDVYIYDVNGVQVANDFFWTARGA